MQPVLGELHGEGSAPAAATALRAMVLARSQFTAPSPPPLIRAWIWLNTICSICGSGMPGMFEPGDCAPAPPNICWNMAPNGSTGPSGRLPWFCDSSPSDGL